MGSFQSKRFYTKEEVSLHCGIHDCWIMAQGKVYDVTRYLSLHPGSLSTLLRKGGQDCTQDYHFHSKRARILWKKYHIGYVE